MKSIKKLIYTLFIVFALLSFHFSDFSPQTVRAAENQSSTFYVTANSVNLRSAPSTSSTILTVLDKGQPVSYLSSSGNWVQIRIADSQTGWIYHQYISGKLSDISNILQTATAKIDQLLEYAYSLLNCKYRFGGASPSGFDCSGFTMHVFSKIGFSLPHQAASQLFFGIEIEKVSLQKGDLVFFKTQGANYINHVGIYIGNGNFIHASSGAGCVRINSLTSGYYLTCYQSARRLFDIG